MTALKTRPPTGRVPWPFVLVEGGEKAGKSWMCAELSASSRVGQTYWIDLGEGSADEYGAIPGARYVIVEHDGSIGQIIAAVEAVKAEAARAAAAGEPPVVLVIDSMTAEWDMLKGIADSAARARLARKGRAVKPEDTPQISMDLWNAVNDKHRKVLLPLMTFPGIAVVTARGKTVAAMDDAGRPIENTKEHKVEGQKGLAFDASVWLRVSREHPPLVVGARSVHAGVKPGEDRPVPVPGLTLERLVFDVLKCNPAEAHVRDLVPLQTGAEALDSALHAELVARIESTPVAELRPVWAELAPAVASGALTEAEGNALADRIKARVAARGTQWARMFELFAAVELEGNAREAYAAEVVGHPVDALEYLTDAEVQAVIARLESWAASSDPAGVAA